MVEDLHGANRTKLWGGRRKSPAGVLDGYVCSAYPAVTPDVVTAGDTDPEIAVNEAHVDRNLVTGPAWPAHPAWLAKFLDVLGTEIKP